MADECRCSGLIGFMNKYSIQCSKVVPGNGVDLFLGVEINII